MGQFQAQKAMTASFVRKREVFLVGESLITDVSRQGLCDREWPAKGLKGLKEAFSELLRPTSEQEPAM